MAASCMIFCKPPSRYCSLNSFCTRVHSLYTVRVVAVHCLLQYHISCLSITLQGVNRLAVTWKVIDDIYQHVDIVEKDKPNPFSLGRKLVIDNEVSGLLSSPTTPSSRRATRSVVDMWLWVVWPARPNFSLQVGSSRPD